MSDTPIMDIKTFKADSIVRIQTTDKPNIFTAGGDPIAYYSDLYSVSGTLQSQIENVSSVLSSHFHDDRYYTETEVDGLVDQLDLSMWELGAGNTIVPKDDKTISTAIIEDFKLNYVTTNTIEDRDSIVIDERVEGMVCFVVDAGIEYRLVGGLNNDSWEIKDDLFWQEAGW